MKTKIKKNFSANSTLHLLKMAEEFEFAASDSQFTKKYSKYTNFSALE